MKDSGIPWIGEIPEGWEVKKLKFSCKLFGRIGFRGYTADDLVSEGEGAITLSPTNMKDMYLDLSHCSYLSWPKYYESPEIMVNKGDVLLVKTASVGKCSYVDDVPMEMTVNPQILVLKEHKDSAKFITYIFQTTIGQSYIDVTKGGSTIFTISQEKIGNYEFVFPPVAEQEAIAEFLDRKCGEVDEMVSLQEQVIEELKAYKQAVITEAVTKGLNPSAPMKPSNIDWIGQIPVEWDVVKLSLMTSKIGSGKTPTGGATIYTESGIMFLRSQNIYNEGLKLDDVAFIPPSIDDTMANTRVKDGDVLLNITGGSIGRCYCINDKNIRANVNQHVCIIRPIIEKLYGKYLQYVINSNVIQTQIRLCQTGSNREELNFEQISNFKIPFMPVSTQREIADFLDRKCADIDALIALKQQKIEELKQYKKSLIYEYVTGKKQLP